VRRKKSPRWAGCFLTLVANPSAEFSVDGVFQKASRNEKSGTVRTQSHCSSIEKGMTLTLRQEKANSLLSVPIIRGSLSALGKAVPE
jgi:hypothetical protein